MNGEAALFQPQGDLLLLDHPAVRSAEDGEKYLVGQRLLGGVPVDVEESREGRPLPALEDVRPPPVLDAGGHVIGDDVQ